MDKKTLRELLRSFLLKSVFVDKYHISDVLSSLLQFDTQRSTMVSVMPRKPYFTKHKTPIYNIFISLDLFIIH